MSNLQVLGAGAWGTALAVHLAHRGHRVSLWARNPGAIAGESPRLPGVALPATIKVSASLQPAAATLVVVPTQTLRGVLATLRPPGPLVLCCKGLETGTGCLPLEIAASILPGTPCAILTGPNFAHEIAASLPAAAVLAAEDAALRARLAALIGGGNFRVYGNEDAVGAQLGGAAKNVVAIAAGAVSGAGLGENARAALITRGLAEIARLAEALGGRAATIAGLSGLGDLVLSCAGPTSRNFRLGFGLGQGQTLQALMPPGGPVVEGVTTAAALLTRAPSLDLPIIAAVHGLVSGEANLPETVARLLARPPRDE